VVAFFIVLAFGFGVGLNPPVDIHIPSTEEIAVEIEEQQKAETIDIGVDG
jgi:hypothetical protein